MTSEVDVTGDHKSGSSRNHQEDLPKNYWNQSGPSVYLRLLGACLLGLSWICSGFILNFMQLLLYLFVRPLNPSLYRKVNYYLIYSNWSQIVGLSEYWAGCKLTVYYADEETRKQFGSEHALNVMNHKYELDWLFCWIFCDKLNCLGNAKTFAKKSLSWIPVIGWGWIFCEMIFLERNWQKDSLILENSLNTLMQYKDYICLLLFAEGTRYTKEKYESSVKFAKEKGLYILKHHLQPRTRGFSFTIQHLKGKMPAIYDTQIDFKINKESAEPVMLSILKGFPIHAHMYIRRIPMDDLPEEQEQLNDFLFKLYRSKDELTDYFHEHGKYPGTAVEFSRRSSTIANLVGWFLVISSLTLYVTRLLIIYEKYVFLYSLGALFVASLFALGLLLKSTKASDGSSYGKTSTQAGTKKEL